MRSQSLGISRLDAEDFRNQILRFDESYLRDWQAWVYSLHSKRSVADDFGRVLRKWQACRPNRMRRTKGDPQHGPPYLEDLIAEASPAIQELTNFDIRLEISFNQQARKALERLWEVFRNLSFQGRSREGLAGVVGISKAVLLLTEGRIGPAFDSEVRSKIGIRAPENAREWIDCLQVVSRDIQVFETANHCTLQEAAPHLFATMHSGRLYDMALGPGRLPT